MRTFKDVCKEVTKEHDKFSREGGGKATSSALLDVAVKIYSVECNNRPSVKPLSAEQIWDIYAEAVGGKTFDGKPLPKFDKLGKQQVGWLAIAEAVNAY